MFNILTKVDKSAETRRNLHTHTHTHTHTGNLLIAFLSTIFIVSGVFADPDIDTATASCSDDVFNSNTGPVNIEVNWEPNEINLHWYNGNTEIQNVPVASQSCVYDDSLTPPSTIPTREGYTFRGWRPRDLTCGLSHVDTSVYGTWNATYGRWKPQNGSNGFTMQNYFGTENSDDLNNGEWAVTFNYGTLNGGSKCSVTNGTFAVQGTPSDTSGENCWCQATKYTPSGENQCFVSSTPWVFMPCSQDCSSRCSYCCAYHVANAGVYSGISDTDFRSELYGQ